MGDHSAQRGMSVSYAVAIAVIAACVLALGYFSFF
jgi:hypothetical protein